MIDVVHARNQIVDALADLNWAPRDADGSDFAKEGSSTRFKVGTSRGEVAITVWRAGKQIDAVRVISDRTLRVALNYLRQTR